jgi:hypothetical protein
MEKIILQIGRLDKNIEQDIKFKFHDKIINIHYHR